MMTLSKIRTELKNKLKSSTIPNSRIDLWANMAQEILWGFVDKKDTEATDTFSTVANIRAYNIASSFNGVISITDETNNRRLEEIGEIHIEYADPDLDQTGAPLAYSVYGSSYVQNQPLAASTISITSSSSTDTTKTITIIGEVSGVEKTETNTFNGTVAVVTSNSFTTIDRVIKSDVTDGDITLTSDSGSTTNVVIPANRLHMEFQTVRLFPTPDAAYTMRSRHYRNPRPMVDANDIPDLPHIWHPMHFDLVMAFGHDDMYEFDVGDKKRSQVNALISGFVKSNKSEKSRNRVIGGRQILGTGNWPSNYWFPVR